MAQHPDLTEGWTGPLPFTLKADDVAVDLTGLTVQMQMLDNGGQPVQLGGSLAVTTAASGLVTYSPGASDFQVVKSPYAVKFKVTDGSGKVVFFPNGPGDTIKVHR